MAASSCEIDIEMKPDTSRISAVLEAIANHAGALAKELRQIQAQAEAEGQTGEAEDENEHRGHTEGRTHSVTGHT